jgi:hypothetical protein
MRFAVYVRKGDRRYDAVGEVPEQLRSRTLAVRAFDAEAMMVGWELVDGRELEPAIARLFDCRAPRTSTSTTRRRVAMPPGSTAPEAPAPEWARGSAIVTTGARGHLRAAGRGRILGGEISGNPEDLP